MERQGGEVTDAAINPFNQSLREGLKLLREEKVNAQLGSFIVWLLPTFRITPAKHRVNGYEERKNTGSSKIGPTKIGPIPLN